MAMRVWWWWWWKHNYVLPSKTGRRLFKRALLLTRADAANWTGINCCKCWASVCCITEFRESKRNSVCMKCSCASSSLASLFNELTKGKNKYNVSQLWTNHKQWQKRLPFAMRREGEGFWKYTNIWIFSLLHSRVLLTAQTLPVAIYTL